MATPNGKDAVFTLDGIGLILEANRHAGVLLACPHDELRGQPFINFVTRADRKRALAAFAELISRDRIQIPLLRLRRKDGRSVTVAIEGRIAKNDGQVAEIVARGIGEKKRRANGGR